MKQKIVMEVPMPCDKCRSKAMQIAAVVHGVVELQIVADKNQLVVIGDGIDSVNLTCKLRKKLKNAKIVSVAEDKEKPTEEKKPKEQQNPTIIPCSSSYVHYPQYTYEVVYNPNPTGCSFM